MSDDGEEPLGFDRWTAFDALTAETAALQLVCGALLRHLAQASPQPARHFAVNFFAAVKRDLQQQPFLPARRTAVAGCLDALAAQIRRTLPGGADPVEEGEP